MLGGALMRYYVEVSPDTWYHTPTCYGRYGEDNNCFLCPVKGPCQEERVPTPGEDLACEGNRCRRRTNASKQ